MKNMRHISFTLIFLHCISASYAQPVEYQLLTGFDNILFHYPGSDELVGTGDDVMMTGVSSFLGSDPNVMGSFSYLAFEIPGFAPDPVVGGNNAALFFLEGSFMIDENNMNLPIPSADVRSTGYGQGVGLLETDVNSVQGLSINGSAISANVNLDVTVPAFGGAVLNFPNLNINGNGSLVFCSPASCNSGIAYLDNIIAPAAMSRGATRIAYLELDGAVPAQATLPVVANNGRAVLVGVTGVQNNIDLSLEKTTTTTLPAMPGQNISYQLMVTNNGSSAAINTVVTDPLSPDVQYLSNSCSAPNPVNLLFRWSIDNINAGQSMTCTINVRVLNQAIFDHHNAAVAYSSQHDSDFTNNISAVNIDTLSLANEGLEQLSNGVTAIPADAHCSACPLTAGGQVPPQTGAENFVVHDAFGLQEIVFSGFYTSGTTFNDNFTIEIYRDVKNSSLPSIPGVPGEFIARITAPVIREGAGPIFTYRVNTNLVLPRGLYWLTIRNDSSPSTNDWAWISADDDTQGRSVPNIAVNSLVPLNLRWTPTDNFRLALQLIGDSLEEIFHRDGFENVTP